MDKIILAFEGEKTGAKIREIIEGDGLAGCILCHSAAEVKRLTNKMHITTVVSGYKLRDETAEALAGDLPGYCSLLVMARQDLLDLLSSDEAFKLPAPASRNELLSSVRMLLQIGHRTDRLVKPRRSDEERELIENAKAVLMSHSGMTEEQAHRFLQTKSMDSGVKLVQMAQMVLDGTWNG